MATVRDCLTRGLDRAARRSCGTRSDLGGLGGGDVSAANIDRANANDIGSMKVHTSGVADVKLTIGKDGSVQKTEIERL